MKNEKVKIADIAKALEVSDITVSRALSGKTGVGESLRRAVLEKAEEMGYQRQKDDEDLHLLILHQKPFIQDTSNYSQMIQGLERAVKKKGCLYDLEYIDIESQKALRLPDKVAKGAAYDGLVFVGRFQKEYVNLLTGKIRNFLLYTGYSPASDYDSVWFNFNNGGYKQCEYLIRMGHERIGFLGDNSVYKNKEKVLGIISALEDHGISTESDFFLYEEQFEERLSALLERKDRPTGIICQWDYTAVRLIKYLYEKGIRVPEDLSIIGSGNTDISALSIPALTTLELNIDHSCEVAVDLLLKRIRRPEKPYENVVVNSSLVLRDSVKDLRKMKEEAIEKNGGEK